METKGYVIIFGSLFAIIGLIVTGATLPHSWYSALMLTSGIVGAIAWFGGIIWLFNVMNSDI